MLGFRQVRPQVRVSLPINARCLFPYVAATYGKAFLPPNMVNNNDIYETSKLLRVVHHLRTKQLRYITYEQLKAMGDEQLLKILLRSREHYLAFELYGYLKKDQNFRIKIYTDWACCRVQNREESED